MAFGLYHQLCRYLQLYDDILVNGSRMFVVTHHHENVLAKVGLIFRLKNLKDVSTDTNGHFKYASHLHFAADAEPRDSSRRSGRITRNAQVADHEVRGRSDLRR